MRKVLLTGFLALVVLAACSGRPAAPPPPTPQPAPYPGLATSAPVLVTPKPTGLPEWAATATPLPPTPLPGPTPTGMEQSATTPANLARASAPAPSPTAIAAPLVPSQQITITLPRAGRLLTSGGPAAGTLAHVPSDNIVSYRVYGPDGHVIGRGSLPAKGRPDGPGTFAGLIRFAARPSRSAGQLEVLYMSPDDGSIVAAAWVNVGFGRALQAASDSARAIAIQWPLPGTQIAPGDEVMGSAAALPVEHDLTYRVYDQGGNLVGSGPVSLEPEGTRSTFIVPVNYEVDAPGPGRVQILDQSQADGRWLDVAFLNVSLIPREQGPVDPANAGPAPAGQPALGGLPLPTDLPATASPGQEMRQPRHR